MLIPKKNRRIIYEELFKDGVMVALKEYNKPKRLDSQKTPSELDKIPNLQVIKAMLSLKSRGFVKENFAWRHHYWFLTNEGIQYLRDYLHLPPEIVPATLKKSTKPDAAKSWKGNEQRSQSNRPGDADRDNYRRDGAAADKAGAGPNFNPDFRGGFGGIGRGRGGAPPS